jgi:hypothetical protein
VCSLALIASVAPAHASQTSASKSSTKKKSTAKQTLAKTTAKKHATTTASAKMHMASSKKSLKKKKSTRPRGQQKIDSERAQAIQEALIREHYLSGEATGTWNAESEAAMRHYQADHGWQSKTVPDSRALIKLGLGPSKDHLLNPDSAMTTVPDAPKATSVPPTSNSAAPVANSAGLSSGAAADSSNPQ